VDPVSNPYSPGAGRRPPELAGRAGELRRFDVLASRLEAGRGDRGIVLTGLRGVGKTVLLNEFRGLAERRGWIVAKVEAGGGRPFRAAAAKALNRGLRTATGRHGSARRLRRALAVFKSFSLQVAPDGSLALGIDVDPALGRADTGDLELDLTELLTDLAETGRELGIGTLLLIDEMQDLESHELAAISGACHEAGQADLPVTLAAAGLPSLPAALAEAKSYAERLFEYRTVGALTAGEAAEALTRPAAAAGVEWRPSALAEVVSVARGYPYFLQVFGGEVWDFAARSPIAPADARAGIASGRRELDTGFYGTRWERATPAQRGYLRALAEHGDEAAPTAAVAARLGRRQGDVSVHRDQLIRKGLLYAPDRGTIAFTVPGMAAYVLRQPSG
jgi:hypothetical protein